MDSDYSDKIINVFNSFFVLDRKIRERILDNMPEADSLSSLTGRQADALFQIFSIVPCSLTEVAKLLKISKPSATKMVEQLYQKQLLTREEDANNRRNCIINVSPLSKEILHYYYVETISEFQKILDKIDTKNHQEIFKTIDIFNKLINEQED